MYEFSSATGIQLSGGYANGSDLLRARFFGGGVDSRRIGGGGGPRRVVCGGFMGVANVE